MQVKGTLFLLLALLPSLGNAQSKAMRHLAEKHEDAFTLMFYYSTMKMLIPEENVEFQDIIYGIEKIKLMKIDNEDMGDENQTILSDLSSDGFEEAMTMRHEGTNMVIYIKEHKGITKGAFFLMESDSTMTVLDLVGEIPINKLFTLSNEIDMLTSVKGIGDF